MRLRRLEEEFAGAIRLEWKSFLLRPEPGAIPRDVAKFREYTRKWARPAADVDAGEFRVWQSDDPPPSHSVPPHLVAKAATTLGDAAFHAVHDRLLKAYFAENRDISSPEVLLSLWRECGLDPAAFARSSDRETLMAVIRDHNEAIELGVNGVPAVRMDGNDVAAVGAQPIELYRRWFEKTIAERSATADSS